MFFDLSVKAPAFIVTRPLHGISLNGVRETLLDDDGTTMRFRTRADALRFMDSCGVDPCDYDIEESE